MLNLLAFLVCEKVIFEKDFETPSLISVMQKVVFQGTEEVPESLPVNTMAPLSWQIFTVWMSEPEDIGKRLIQQAVIETPDNSPSPVKTFLPFTVKDGFNTNAIKILGFPVGYPSVKIKIWLESESGEKISPDFFYPIGIERLAAGEKFNAKKD
jgi:hypothetical protein